VVESLEIMAEIVSGGLLGYGHEGVGWVPFLSG